MKSMKKYIEIFQFDSHLKWNLISHISPNAFVNNPLLQELDLSENQIKNLHCDTFNGLYNLSKL